MIELTASIAETRANFSKIANTVRQTGKPVTVIKNSKPWVVVAPVSSGFGDNIPIIDWNASDVIKLDASSNKTILPAEWNCPEDEGLYDDLV